MEDERSEVELKCCHVNLPCEGRHGAAVTHSPKKGTLQTSLSATENGAVYNIRLAGPAVA